MNRVTPRQLLRRAVVETLEQRRLLSITPSISGANTATEGANYTLTLAYTGNTPQQWDISWGDGYDPDGNGDGKQRIAGNPATVTHKYADGDILGTPRTIVATAFEAGGATYDSNSKAIVVQNYQRVAGISGSNFAYTNRSYTLSLLDYDPGDDTVSAWKINWGDGSPEETLSGDPNSATHTYTATSGNPTITAKVVDEDGIWPVLDGEYNQRTITVRNESPADEVLVDSRSTAAVTGSVTLTSGVRYRLVGSGWGSMDLYHKRRMDPEYYDYQNGTPTDVAAIDGTDVGISRVNAATGALIATNWGPYSASHAYEIDIIGDGQPLALKFVDRAGFYGDNAGTFAVAAFAVSEVKELTVAADGDPDNRGLASAAHGSVDFYLAPNSSGNASIVIDGLVSPNDATTRAKSLWAIDTEGNGASDTAGTFNDSLALRTVTLTNDVSDEYTITAGVDDNGNGVLESSEVERTVNLRLTAPQTVVVGPEVIDFQIGAYEAAGTGGGSGGGGSTGGTLLASPFVPLNADYDEQNRNGDGDPVPDNVGNAATTYYDGQRIRDGWDAGVSDSELRVAVLQLAPTFAGRARWKVNLPEAVKLWYWWPTGSRWRPNEPHWGLVINNQFSMPDTMPQTYLFMIEGVTPSTENLITATLLAESGNAEEYVNPGTAVTVVSADLDVDGDNDDGFAPPKQNVAEEYNEDVPHALASPAEAAVPGKTVALNNGDADGDGVVDYADGFDLDGIASNGDDASPGAAFVPLVLELPAPLDLATAAFRLSYSGSGPATMSGTTPGAGHLRVWTKNGNVARDGRSVTAGGDYVTPDTVLTPQQLGLSASNRTVTLWIEGIAATTAGGVEEDILLQLAPGGATAFAPPAYDRVRVSVGGNGGAPVVVPNVPTGLAAGVASATQVNLDWNDNAEPGVAYHVYRGTTATFTPDDATNRVAAGVTESRYVDDDAPGAGSYFYKIKAVVSGIASAGTTAAAADTTVTPTTPAAPGPLTFSNVTGDSMTVAWTDNSLNELGFKVRRSADGGATWEDFPVGTNGTSFNNAGLNADTNYTFDVLAHNGGPGTSTSGPSTQRTQATTPGGPSAPGIYLMNALKLGIAGRLAISKWERAFTFKTQGTEIAEYLPNFMDDDPDRFYVLVIDPTKEGEGSIEASISTDSPGTDYDSASTPTQLTERPGQPGWFDSKAQILVSSRFDLDPPLPSHTAALGGQVHAEYENLSTTAPVPVYKRINAHAVFLTTNFGTVFAGEPFTDSNGNRQWDNGEGYDDISDDGLYSPRLTEVHAAERFLQDVKVANEIYAPLGIKIDYTTVEFTYAAKFGIPFLGTIDDGKIQVSAAPVSGYDELTETEEILLTTGANSPDRFDLEVFYVDQIMSDPTVHWAGWAFAGIFYDGFDEASDDVNGTLMISTIGGVSVLAHELGHILPQADGHTPNPVNLMSNGVKLIRPLKYDDQTYVDSKRITALQEEAFLRDPRHLLQPA